MWWFQPSWVFEVAVAVTAPGGLHHIWEGMGDTGSAGVVPQTLHTIEQGICA